jgi:hypothetical protein
VWAVCRAKAGLGEKGGRERERRKEKRERGGEKTEQAGKERETGIRSGDVNGRWPGQILATSAFTERAWPDASVPCHDGRRRLDAGTDVGKREGPPDVVVGRIEPTISRCRGGRPDDWGGGGTMTTGNDEPARLSLAQLKTTTTTTTTTTPTHG